MWYKGKEYYGVNKWVGIFNRDYKDKGIKVNANDIHQLFGYYKIPKLKINGNGEIVENGRRVLYPVNLVNQVRTMKEDFMYVLSNIIEYGVSNGEEYYKPYKEQVIVEPTYKDNENDMEKYSDNLIDKYQFENKKTIKLTESQIKRIFENFDDEGFRTNKFGQFMFEPNKDSKADTRIFNDTSKELKVRKVLLPKSNIISYNLYQINNMDVNRALKHKQKMDKTPITWFSDYADYGDTNYSKSITHFINRSCLYMKRIIGNNPVDYITYPQSSSEFNSLITNKLLSMYPNSQGIKLVPQMLVKNVRGIFVNTDIAKQIGLTNDEIYKLMNRVEKWKKDEDIRDLRREIEVLKKEIEETLKNRGRGRPSKEFINKQNLININNQKIKALRKQGRDSTVDDFGNIKDFQIKSLDDKTRRAIEGLFTINPQYLSLQNKLRGKTIILFDDNISSGATMDDLCLLLQRYGVANIIPITLGTISPTIYKQSERTTRHIGEN